MKLFNDDFSSKFEEHAARIADAEQRLMPFADIVGIADLKKLREDFRQQTEDFAREDRKLNIGVIGSVKAGKSTFLNTLLFDGRDVLPKAATPKTAALTKIEYGEKNVLVAEFYTEEDWKNIRQTAEKGTGDRQTVAKEIVKLAFENGGVNAEEIVREGTRTIDCSSTEDLMSVLNDYVGENGKFTAFVKSVTLYINNPALNEISIVDTPGMNDPIVVRTDRTKEFLRKCDVVFFLSKAGEFLEGPDLDLLASQLPSEGVARIILIASIFDGVFNFEDYDDDVDLEYLIRDQRKKRFATAEELITREKKRFSELGHDRLSQVIDECRRPLCISSMAWNMSKKQHDEYSRMENIIFDALNENGDLDDNIGLLEEIGNIPAAEKIFDEVVQQKEITLEEKADTLIPTNEIKFREKLRKEKDTAEKKLNVLNTKEKSELEEQKRIILGRKNAIISSISAIFADAITAIETEKGKSLSEIRSAMAESTRLDMNIEEKWISKQVKVKDSKWYKPWTWGSYHYEDHGHTETTQYYNVSQAIDNVNQFVSTAQSEAEAIFTRALDLRRIRRELINTILGQFDSSSENFDPAFFRTVIENSIMSITFPTIYFDSEHLKTSILSRFQGKITQSKEQAEFLRTLNEVISALFSGAINDLTNSVSSFKQEMSQLKDSISEQIIKDINTEYDEMCRRFDQKNAETERFEKLIDLLSEILNRV